MYLQAKNQDMVEVITLEALFDPCQETITGRFHAGEEQQDPQTFAKKELHFPSGETLPACWTNPDYRKH